MPKDREAPTVNQHGADTHPAYGMCRVSRVTAAPGEPLFQSDLLHREYIDVTLSEAERFRDLNRDWTHAGRTVARFSMSMAQWAELVSSLNTEGVPVTLEYANGHPLPGLLPDSRTRVTAEEAHNAAQKAFKEIQEAQQAYFEALDNKAPAAERKALKSKLQSVTANAAPNVDFATKRVDEHIEEVVRRSRADIEAMVRQAQQRGDQVAIDMGEQTALEQGGEGFDGYLD